MFNIEIVEDATQTALDIVSVDDMCRHLRLSPTQAANATWRQNIEDAIRETVDDLEGIGGKLNRCVLPRTLKRIISGFPKANCFISLPYPPLISVEAVTIEDGSSPPNIVPSSGYAVNSLYVGSITALNGWPSVTPGPGVASITYKAGYLNGEYPPKLKRLIKILAAHALENTEASINEPRQMAINRKVDFGVDWLMDTLKVSNSYDDYV